VRAKGERVLEDWAVKQDDGFGVWLGSMAEKEDVSVGSEATDDFAAWRGIKGLAQGADGDFAVIVNADASLLAPDIGPPRAGWGGTQDGTVFGQGLSACGAWSGVQFAMDFVLVGMEQELVEQAVGSFQFEDVIGREQWGQAFLPVVMAAFDFALGLGRGGVAEGNAVEVQRGAQLSESIGGVGEEEGAEVHIKGQGQAFGEEDAREEIEMGQEVFPVVEARAGVVASGVVQQIEQDLFVRIGGQPGVGTGVVLPKGTVVASLPAFDGFGRGFEAGVRGQIIFDGPAPNTGAVGFEVEAAMKFAGGGAVGGRRFGRQQFGEQINDRLRPGRTMVAAGKTGQPSLDTAFGASAEILAVELVEAGQGKPQFECGGWGVEPAKTMIGQNMTNEGSGQTFDQL